MSPTTPSRRLGWLAARSGMFPRVFGPLLMVGGLSYMTDLAVQILDPSLADRASEIILAPAVIAEMSVIAFLLIKGVGQRRQPQPSAS